MRRNLLAASLILVGVLLMTGAFWSIAGRSAASPALSSLVAVQSIPLDRSPDPPRQRVALLPGVDSAAQPAPALPDGAVAALTIPKLGVSGVPVFNRATDGQGNMLIAKGYAVTRFSYSADFGAGNTVLYGHDDIEGSVFARLKDLEPGDEVDVFIGGETSRYQVTGRQIVQPTAVQILQPTSDVRLTLFTCWPNFVDTQRVVITATPRTDRLAAKTQ